MKGSWEYKKCQAAYRGWYSSLGVGRVAEQFPAEIQLVTSSVKFLKVEGRLLVVPLVKSSLGSSARS
jgi:hypothetical protein